MSSEQHRCTKIWKRKRFIISLLEGRGKQSAAFLHAWKRGILPVQENTETQKSPWGVPSPPMHGFTPTWAHPACAHPSPRDHPLVCSCTAVPVPALHLPFSHGAEDPPGTPPPTKCSFSQHKEGASAGFLGHPTHHCRLAQLSDPIPTRIASAQLFKILGGQQHHISRVTRFYHSQETEPTHKKGQILNPPTMPCFLREQRACWG